ncbi:GntR family transcriptional regulator [Asaia sp. W19]|uniref:GntR family transcriptional regulator n=1 Tax=unclassified Asaia TaxID=2685023 RepID=UPI000F8E6B8D|nr:GntR family transcriptional regulator [Asaia sp. W19]RUT24112.1 GntR family transcriptional regulator [Asaia sp. W19]RUT27201.1 GntR family transcriptional regulator [Asaia sp. W19]
MTTSLPDGTIDRLSTTPYYAQLSSYLETLIASGQYATGARLPSEHELCTRFELSRATVRQALQTLETRGLIQRISGRGAFVCAIEAPQGWMIQGDKGFLETALSHGRHDVSTAVLKAGETILPECACTALELAQESAGYELVRLRALRDVPALYSINYSPPALIPVLASGREVLEGRSSLSSLLARSGYPLQGAHRSIMAVAAPREIAHALDIRRAAPLLRVRSVSWRPDGTRFDMYEAWVRSDLIPLEVDVNAL